MERSTRAVFLSISIERAARAQVSWIIVAPNHDLNQTVPFSQYQTLEGMLFVALLAFPSSIKINRHVGHVHFTTIDQPAGLVQGQLKTYINKTLVQF